MLGSPCSPCCGGVCSLPTEVAMVMNPGVWENSEYTSAFGRPLYGFADCGGPPIVYGTYGSIVSSELFPGGPPFVGLRTLSWPLSGEVGYRRYTYTHEVVGAACACNPSLRVSTQTFTELLLYTFDYPGIPSASALRAAGVVPNSGEEPCGLAYAYFGWTQRQSRENGNCYLFLAEMESVGARQGAVAWFGGSLTPVWPGGPHSPGVGVDKTQYVPWYKLGNGIAFYDNPLRMQLSYGVGVPFDIVGELYPA